MFPSTTACCRDQTNTKEHSHKLVNTQGECAHTYAHTPHTYSHTQHMQGIDAESEEEALGNALRQATECCKDDTNIKQDTHKQINSQEECVHVYQHKQHIQSIGEVSVKETFGEEFEGQGMYQTDSKTRSENQTE